MMAERSLSSTCELTVVLFCSWLPLWAMLVNEIDIYEYAPSPFIDLSANFGGDILNGSRPSFDVRKVGLVVFNVVLFLEFWPLDVLSRCPFFETIVNLQEQHS